jgi:acid phosphatase type 7
VHFVSIYLISGKALRAAAVRWITNDITAAVSSGQRWIIPFMHFSPFTDGTSHPGSLDLRRQLGPLFESLGVKIVFTAHDQAFERSFPLTDMGATDTPTSTSMTCYTLGDGVTWVKVSPGGKMSDQNDDFSQFASPTPPAWTATRDNTMHHFARLRVSSSGTIAVDTYGVVGNGSPIALVDSFMYTTGVCP